MSTGYKPPKFDIFDGTCDPHAHLRAYCDKLVGVGRNEKLRMKLFIRSLTGETLTCYTHQDTTNWRQEQLMLIDEKRMDAVCHSQLYQNRMANAFNKRVKPCQFISGKLVLKKKFTHQDEAKGKYKM
ncbi:uncharacterized protein [Nicotiana tomentosiformis]|uniref:uncharacterized protein n=1 Tax=Nicotiana tomentosiformis TaxID=4098 RepID=UPI00388C93B4